MASWQQHHGRPLPPVVLASVDLEGGAVVCAFAAVHFPAHTMNQR